MVTKNWTNNKHVPKLFSMKHGKSSIRLFGCKEQKLALRPKSGVAPRIEGRAREAGFRKDRNQNGSQSLTCPGQVQFHFK